MTAVEINAILRVIEGAADASGIAISHRIISFVRSGSSSLPAEYQDKTGRILPGLKPRWMRHVQRFPERRFNNVSDSIRLMSRANPAERSRSS